jgi:tetratricopeptide (TPR) repeat protein
MLLLLLAAAGTACSRLHDSETPRPEVPSSQLTADDKAVNPVAMPDVSRLAPLLRDRVRERYSLLEKTIARGATGEEIGRAYGDVGLMFMAAEYLEAAATSLHNAQALDPSNPRWPYYLGQFYLARGERAQALTYFHRASALRPTDFPTLIWLGEMYLDQGRPDDAQRVFAGAVTLQPQSAAAVSGVGRALVAQGKTSSATEYLLRALELEPEATSLHYPLAMVYRSLGELDKADAHLRQRGRREATFSDPLMDEYRALLESALAYQNRGLLALQAGDNATAAALFRRGLELEPDNPAIGTVLGTALYQLGQVEAAIKQFEGVLRQSPTYARAHFSLGVILVSQKRYQEALKRFEAAVRSEPDYVEARLNLAAGLQVMGRSEEALTHYKQVVQLDPREAEAWIEGAGVLVHLGRYQEAHDWLAKAKKALPEEPELVSLNEKVEQFLASRRRPSS